jgi:molybdopterin/thiamine biosynthesis adenylyltransferase
MYIAIQDRLLSLMKSASESMTINSTGGALLGRVLDGGDVAQITALGDLPAQGIGTWVYATDPSQIRPLVADRAWEGQIFAILTPEGVLSFFVGDSETLQSVEHEVVRLYANFYSRLTGLFDTNYLMNKTVTVVGLGTGGGMAALELAKTGIGHFRLVDYDRLEVHNIARHVCGLSDLGRYKTRAVADLLRDTHPAMDVETFEFDVLKDRDLLIDTVRDSDLVIGATDSEASKRFLNQVCWSLGVPAIYGAAYDRAFGGDVVRIIPPETPCYECFYSQVVELFETAPKKGNLDYTSADLSKVVAEPGLGIDVAFITLILSKMALLTLLRGTDSTLEDLPTHWVMWGNRSGWAFQKPLESIFLEFERNAQCPVCQAPEVTHERTLQMLGLTDSEYQQSLKQLSDEIENLPTVSLEEILDPSDQDSAVREVTTKEE